MMRAFNDTDLRAPIPPEWASLWASQRAMERLVRYLNEQQKKSQRAEWLWQMEPPI
jgi:hypothetical protein